MLKKKILNPLQKLIIFKELLENQITINQLTVMYQVHPNEIYNGHKKLFEQAEDYIFSFKPNQNTLKQLVKEIYYE